MTAFQISTDIEFRLRKLEVIDRITQISIASDNIQDVLRGVLDLVLEVFNADRAWFLYPCDPEAPSWSVPMERTRQEWPGQFAQDVCMPMDSNTSGAYKELLRANGALQYGPDTEHPVPALVAQQFSVKSQLMISLHPKIGKSWVLGLHHCVSAVKHDESEVQLFTSIAFRIADILSGLLAVQQLRESEIRIREQAEAELQKSEAWFRSIFENVNTAIVSTDRSGRITSFNEAFRAMLGYDAKALKKMNFADFTHPDDLKPEIVFFINEALAHKRNINHIKKRYFAADGRILWLDISVSVIPNVDGKVNNIVAVVQDITERKEDEALQHKLLRQLQDKELAKSRFLAAAGHDLRQPLAAASLYIDALKLIEPTPEQDEIIQRLAQSMSTFNALLDALLNISVLDSGMIKPEYDLINVAELVTWIEQNFAPLAGEKQLGLKLYFPMRETLVVRSDIGLVKSVLMNLVSNAIKFTEKGGILVSVRRRGKDALFQVWDTGMGIPEQHMKQIFDEFYQINNPQRDRTAGLGLGLTIAKRALALLGQYIKCHSRIGHGSVFEFRLPLDESSGGAVGPEVAVAAREDIVNGSFARGKRFVVVEDDVLVAQAMVNLLESLGGEARCFHGAADPLRHANIEHADYFIVDYMLGGELNGIQFLNLLRQKLGKPIRAVLVTGDTSAKLISEAAKLDWPVLYKPVNLAKLIASLSAQVL